MHADFRALFACDVQRGAAHAFPIPIVANQYGVWKECADAAQIRRDRFITVISVKVD